MIPESVKYKLLVGRPLINWLNRNLRPANWLARMKTKEKIKLALAGGKPVKLFIGCGRCRLDPTWLHADIHHGEIYINALSPSPFNDSTVDFIFSEHFIEHVPEPMIRRFWRECFRILKPGGWMRHSTPDLRFYIKLYQGEVENVSLDMFYSRIRHIRPMTPHPCIFMNEILYLWGHLFNYDEDYLGKMWEEAGFVNIKRSEFGKSLISELNNLEQHAVEDWYQQQATLVMEAQKPEK